MRKIHVVVDEWLELSIENDKGTQFAICNLSFALLNFAFFKQSFVAAFLCVRAEKKRVRYLFIFVIQENEILISVIRFFFAL